MSNTFPYRGGVPTRPDVDKLMAKFGVPAVGDVVPYGDIETELKLVKHSGRWNAVIGAWRRFLYRQHNVHIETVMGLGYRAAPNDTRVMHASNKVRHGIKRVVQGGELAAKTSDDNLNIDQKRARDHIVLASGKLAALAHQQTRQIPWKF